jgi:hypothetical protein
MNWTKISANAGIAFFSTLSGTAIAGQPDAMASVVSAVILAGLAFFTELKLESEKGKHQEKLLKAQCLINKSLIV